MASFYRPIDVPASLPWVSARVAVLGRIFPKSRNETWDDKTTISAARLLLMRWRGRAAALDALGLTRSDSGDSYLHYLEDCPPTLVRWDCGGLKRKRCQVLPCPWCWARQNVFQAWDTIDAAISKLGASWATPGSLRLAVGSSREFIGRRDAGPLEEGPGIMSVLQSTWRSWKGSGAVGAISFGGISPVRSGGWQVYFRFLGLVKEKFVPGSREIRVGKLDWPTMARFVSRYASYPRGYLMAPASEVHMALIGMRGVRCRQTFGACYGLKVGSRFEGDNCQQQTSL